MENPNEQFEEGQIVLCTVERILGTTVFVKIQGNGEGTITLSEIAPGRIRNLRDYVVPNKQIVCKILSIKNSSIHLSLRRVAISEKKELLERINREKSYTAMLKTVIGKEEAEKLIEKILQEQTILELFEQARQNTDILEKYLNKEQSQKIIQILESKKEKPKEMKQIFTLSNKSPNGVIIIKEILNESCEGTRCRVKYLAAGKYSLTLSGEDFKSLKSENSRAIETIEKLAKKQHCEFSLEKN
jgi:translation initiation factor 2 alpha subunit (eIF-2alpha)